MRVFKPLQLSLGFKNFEWEKQQKLSINFLLGFSFDGGEPLLEPDLWKFISAEIGKDGVLDMGMPKPLGEVIVYGSYHAPAGHAVTADKVSFKIGNIKKELTVIGDRYWRPLAGPSEPQSFTEMPIDYAHAFGGSTFDRNPLGKGIDEVTDDFGDSKIWLPNIEHSSRLISSKDGRPEPSGFAPLGITWPQRMSKMGTYDDKWLRDRFPGYPVDLDWTHFNTAAADQWLDGFLNGNEEFEINHMHPEKRNQQGKLPGYRARCFIEQSQNDTQHFREIEMRAETLWLFPHKNTGILLWRGVAEIKEDDASDIAHMMIGYENMRDTPKPATHYEQAMRNRTDPDNGFKYLMTTKEMIPDNEICGYARMMFDANPPEMAMQKNMQAKAESLKQEAAEKLEQQKQQLKEQLERAGEDPTPYLEKMSLDQKQEISDPKMAELMTIVDEIAPKLEDDPTRVDLLKVDLTKIDDFRVKAEEVATDKKNEARQQLVDLKSDLLNNNDLAGNETADEAIEQINAAIQRLDKPPLPRPPGQEIVEQLHSQAAYLENEITRLREQGVSEENLPEINFNLEQLEQQLNDGTSKLKETYRTGAHFMDEGTPPHNAPLDIIAHRFFKTLKKGEPVKNGDYAGIDLSGHDLRGVDLSGCYLEQVNFSGANLSGANLTNAILSRAILIDTDLSHTNCEGANLGATKLNNANLTGANLKNAKLDKADLQGATLVNCNMEGINTLLEAKLLDVDMSGSSLPSNPNFLDLDLTNARFQNTVMPTSNFINCTMRGANFNGANVDGSNWVESNLDHSIFTGVSANNARFLAKCSLKKANFESAKLDKSNFREANLEGSNFTYSSLEMADFGSANAQKADFSHSQGKRAMFMKTDLGGANLQAMTLYEGSLLKARLTQTDLTGGNFYGAEFMNATVGETDFTFANLDMTKLADWRPGK